jgi:hypothetical protein
MVIAEVVATTFELLPERIDVLGFVLSLSGIGALGGALTGVLRRVGRERRAQYTEMGALYAGGGACGLFLLLYLLQEVV